MVLFTKDLALGETINQILFFWRFIKFYEPPEKERTDIWTDFLTLSKKQPLKKLFNRLKVTMRQTKNTLCCNGGRETNSLKQIRFFTA